MFSQWRTRARVRAAAARLADGHSIARTRQHVGYTTATGFTRAFHRHIGFTPREYLNRARLSGATAAEKAGSNVAALLAEHQPGPPPIPAYSGPVRVNDCHALLWIYRGESTILIGNRDQHLGRGDAIWVPAGVSHQVELAAESTLRVLGVRYGRVRTGVDDLKVFSFPPDAESYLLHVSMAEFGPLRPDSPPPLIDELFAEQFRRAAPPGDDALVGVIGTIAVALRRDPADPRSLAEWAETLGTTPTMLSREYATQTGTTFPRWRAQLRMNIARDLLFMGERPSVIARKLGYARPVSFTKVFTAAHGIPPREYVRRETEQWVQSADHGVLVEPLA